MRVLALILTAVMAAACRTGEPCPAPGETRCAAQVAEVCSGGGEWVPFMDCDEVALQSGNGPWVCGPVEVEEGKTVQRGCIPTSGRAR